MMGLSSPEMTLKTIHLLFITLSALLAWGFAAWCFGMRDGTTETHPILGVISVATGVALIAYEVLFVRKLKQMRVP